MDITTSWYRRSTPLFFNNTPRMRQSLFTQTRVTAQFFSIQNCSFHRRASSLAINQSAQYHAAKLGVTAVNKGDSHVHTSASLDHSSNRPCARNSVRFCRRATTVRSYGVPHQPAPNLGPRIGWRPRAVTYSHAHAGWNASFSAPDRSHWASNQAANRRNTQDASDISAQAIN